LSVALAGLSDPSSLSGPQAAQVFGGMTAAERQEALQDILVAGGNMNSLAKGSMGLKVLATVSKDFFGVANKQSLRSLGLAGTVWSGSVSEILGGKLDVTGRRLLAN
jgi:hypothetical protein